ncbi:MAG: winged helix-turn-helix domain-containing protein [Halobacteriales archaeon]|nr:winged helix-turn-helix domain-containing protein [Halobacteriales archaeon]
MSENERDDHGQFQAEHDDQEYLAAVAAHEPAGTTEIADAVGVTRQNADKRLRRLRDDGKLDCKKIGTSLVWTLSEGQAAIHHVDPDDAFWDAETYAGDEMSATDIDDILYG